MTPRYLIFALAVIAGLAWTPVAWAQSKAALVQIDAVIREPLRQTFTVIGRLVSRQRGDVAARIAGPVAELRVQVGDRVRRGDVIAVVDATRPAWRRDVAAAEAHESEASKINAEARHAMAEAGVARADARLAQARQAFTRLDRLRASVAFSQARLDDLEQETIAAMSEVDFARAAVQEALSLIDQNLARVERSRANLANAIDDLDDTAVRAPFDGVVTLRHTELGAYLDVGAAVITLVNDRDVEIEADVPYDRLGALSAGSEVSFRFDAGPWSRASVRAIGVVENPRTRTRSVRFMPDLDGVADNLADGQSVSLSLPVGPPRDIVTVHKDAITRGVNGAAVFVVNGDAAERRLVSLGEAIGNRFEVLGGLEPGELVVVRGNERLKPGQTIQYEGQS
ncbi:MAG: efflux RND transporter periplasmic adaptor subunit [Proteobacteria bacterium]|nr:efflux RND transporter periplasmic adaptor subunit [Pseudomonadota bacterium]